MDSPKEIRIIEKIVEYSNSALKYTESLSYDEYCFHPQLV